MRTGFIDLDFQHQEFLTKHAADEIEEFNKLSHNHRAGQADSRLHRNGAADPKNREAHPEGDAIRIARDRVSGLMFAQIATNLPSDLSSPHLEKNHARIVKANPYYVPGNGYWVPLKELLPEHPHAQSEPIREAHIPVQKSNVYAIK